MTKLLKSFEVNAKDYTDQYNKPLLPCITKNLLIAG